MTPPAIRGTAKFTSNRSSELPAALAALPRLVGLWPGEVVHIADPAFAGLLARLRCALRAERQRGIAGHWSYDLARHSELLTVYRILVDAHRHCATGIRRHAVKRKSALHC